MNRHVCPHVYIQLRPKVCTHLRCSEKSISFFQSSALPQIVTVATSEVNKLNYQSFKLSSGVTIISVVAVLRKLQRGHFYPKVCTHPCCREILSVRSNFQSSTLPQTCTLAKSEVNKFNYQCFKLSNDASSIAVATISEELHFVCFFMSVLFRLFFIFRPFCSS